MSTGQGSAGNVIAALASFFIPGLGQLLQGRLFLAIVQFVLAAVLWLVLLGWIIHLWSIIDAASFSALAILSAYSLRSASASARSALASSSCCLIAAILPSRPTAIAPGTFFHRRITMKTSIEMPTHALGPRPSASGPA